MAATITMPKLGLTMTEGLLAEWRVAVGDKVETGDVLFVVETDKIATDVEARAAGTIESIEVSAGETVPVGAVVATWTGPSQGREGGEDAAHEAPVAGEVAQPAAASPAEPVKAENKSAGGRIVATPLARRIARQDAISLEGVVGSGPNGRIKMRDVLDAKAASQTAVKPAVPAQQAPAASAPGARRAASSFEQTVARRLVEAKQQIPHFYVMGEADATKLLKLRTELNAQLDVKVSVNHLIVAAVLRALSRNPEMNTVWDNGEIVTLATVDIGVAVDTPQGLYAPVAHDLSGRSIQAIALAVNDVTSRARDGALKGADLSGGAITVSNVGMLGASWLIPIINPGQSAIIGVGKTKPEFRPSADGQPELRQIISLVLSGDHRVHDGAKAARFLNDITDFLENPFTLLL